MRLTQYSDYALRSLIYLAVKPRSREELVNINDIAKSYGISKNHLTKIIHQLSKLGMVDSVRGKNGGIRLAKHPNDINIGEVVRQTEADFAIVECFLNSGNPAVSTAQDNAAVKSSIPLIEIDHTPVKETSDFTPYGFCMISPVCQLKGIFSEATAEFLAVLDRYTLADIIQKQTELRQLLA